MSEPPPEERSPEPVTIDRLASDLRSIGVETGQPLLVHSSLASLGWVCGGAPAVVDALQRVVGADGTLVMPTFSWRITDPADMVAPEVPEEWYDTIREHLPPYRPAVTPTIGMGAIPECFRTYPGVRRSEHPHYSFAAWGPDADFVTENHPLDFPLGEESPLARVYELDGDVLYLGTTHGNNSSRHLAEYRVDRDPELETNSSVMVVDGERTWVQFEDITFDEGDWIFDCPNAFEREHPAAVETGTVGVGDAKLFSQPAFVDFAVEWLAANWE